MFGKIKQVAGDILKSTLRTAGFYTLEEIVLDAAKTDETIKRLDNLVLEQDEQFYFCK